MSGNVVRLHTTQAEVEAAWAEYHAAMHAHLAMYAPESTATERQHFEAAMNVRRLWRRFAELYDRMA